MIKQALQSLSSLKFTVVLLCLSMLLVLGGTGAQKFDGLWDVQARYFHSYFVVALFRDLMAASLLDHILPTGFNIPGGIPMPGGYVLGLLLLASLVAALIVRTQYTWDRTGLILAHLGIIFLLVGEGITSGVKVEGQMAIQQGGSSNYVCAREPELAIVDTSPTDKDRQTAIPVEMLARAGAASGDAQKTITDPRLPFAVRIDRFYPNSEVFFASGARDQNPMRATAGEAKELVAIERPPVPGTDAEKADTPGAYVAFLQDGKELGRYMVSYRLPGSQSLQADGKTYLVSLRRARTYKPYSMHLLKASHDTYLGTDIPKNFSSKLRFVDPTHHEDREILIKMNEPFRYRGETFYQERMTGDTATGLQVVRNPAWTMPYVACAVGGVGLCLHFVIMLVRFLQNRALSLSSQLTAAKADPSRTTGAPWIARGEVLMPLGMALLSIFIIGVHLAPRDPGGAFDVKQFSTLPVNYEGRIQPLDSLARNAMKIMRGREGTTIADKSNPAKQKAAPAIQWLLDSLVQSPDAAEYKVFRIDFPDVVDLLGRSRSETYFSASDVEPGFEKLRSQAQAADAAPEKDRSQFQVQVLRQWQRFALFWSISDLRNLYLAAPLAPGEQWTSAGELMRQPKEAVKAPESMNRVTEILKAYRDGKPAEFNRQVEAYHQVLDRALPSEMAKVRFEAFFNHFDPFMAAKELYVFAFLAAAISWLVWTEPLRKAGLTFILFAIGLHTFGLICRMYISGRPPVTNLASSAIFIGWVCAGTALFLEVLYRNGLGIAVAGVIAWPTLFIADQLSLDGDTMKVLMAVLDTNIWLATHVVVITIGYAATFLAGALGCVYIFFGLCTPLLDDTWRKRLIRAIYGVTGFAIIGSFVGTVLGGIWADQSWGRFWGWDPKENGAVIIVLANAILLHARWAGWVKDRGLAALAVCGNIVTAWSWFGTNMLGIGLHSYGFMPGAFVALSLFVFSQLVLIGMALVPEKAWVSLQRYPRTPDLPIPVKTA
ncbi:MAG: cytochrome c biogenesis protein CcsA [Tepidisphaerales bacterium]